MVTKQGDPEKPLKKCPCCEKPVPELHGKSHVVPDWMSKPYYDAKHRVSRMHVDDGIVESLVQTSFHGKFWCNECEDRSSTLDRYASQILPVGATALRKKLGVTATIGSFQAPGREPVPAIQWTGIDFNKLYRFIISIFLRWELWERSKGNPGELGEKHFNAFRSIYLADTPVTDDHTYPVLAECLVGDKKEDEVGSLSTGRDSERHRILHVRAAGYDFIVYVSSHTKPSRAQSLALKKDGSWITILRRISMSPITGATLRSVLETTRASLKRKIFSKKGKSKPTRLK